jgi:hypothetical protein
VNSLRLAAHPGTPEDSGFGHVTAGGEKMQCGFCAMQIA